MNVLGISDGIETDDISGKPKIKSSRNHAIAHLTRRQAEMVADET